MAKNTYDKMLIFIIITAIGGIVSFGYFNFNVLAGVICLPFAIKELITRRFIGLKVFFLLWFLYGAVSLVWSPYHEFGFRAVWHLLWSISIFLGMYYCACNATNPQHSIMQGWIILLCFSFIVAFFEIFTNSHIPGYGDFNMLNHNSNRIYAAVTYGNLNTYGMLLIMSIPVVISSFISYKNKVLPFIVLLCIVIISIINASRAAFICLIIDAFIFLLFYHKLKFKHKTLMTLIGVAIISIIVIYLGRTIFSQLYERIISSSSVENFTEDKYRADLLTMGIEGIKESHWMGFGAGSMMSYYESHGSLIIFAHNLVIEYCLEYGVILFLIFMLFLLSWWYKLCKSNDMSYKVFGYLSLFSFLPIIILNHEYFINSFVWIWLVTQFIFSTLSTNSSF